MKRKVLNLLKIGGNVIDQRSVLNQFLFDFHQLDGPKLLVHGGGKLATSLATDLGIETQMIDGRRVTDQASLRVVTMVYAGWINKSITAQLQSLGCASIGLSGADAGIIKGTKRSASPVDYGFVADIARSGVDATRVHHFIEDGLCPVFCSIAADMHGQLLNCNADTIASVLAVALSAYYDVRLIFCFEKLGVLSDPGNEQSWIPLINNKNYAQLRATGVISGGMIPKIDNAFEALHAGVSEVQIKHASNIDSNDVGTSIIVSD